MLQQLRYRVLSAGSVPEALRFWRAHRAEIDLVMMDVVMPRRSGLYPARILRDEAPSVAVVILSAYAHPAETLDAPADGMTEYPHKPVEPDMLASTLAHMHGDRAGAGCAAS